MHSLHRIEQTGPEVDDIASGLYSSAGPILNIAVFNSPGKRQPGCSGEACCNSTGILIAEDAGNY